MSEASKASGAKFGYTSLSQKLTGRTNAGPNKRAKETTRGNKTNQTSEALILAESTFSRAAEGSDEGSRSVTKWSGVPHWENQQKCTSGSIDPGLVGLGDLEKHP